MFNDFFSGKMVSTQTLNNILADLVWWFGFSLDDLDKLTLSELDDWIQQANRQQKAGYARL